MPRPRRCRNINFEPKVLYFKPQGVPLRDLKVIVLTLEEFESIRLKDYQNMTQTTAATKMGISQPTFQRILTNARKKIAEGIVMGKAIEIITFKNT
jgi:predicted DNA-binding protein (UPF0251 family)